MASKRTPIGGYGSGTGTGRATGNAYGAAQYVNPGYTYAAYQMPRQPLANNWFTDRQNKLRRQALAAGNLTNVVVTGYQPPTGTAGAFQYRRPLTGLKTAAEVAAEAAARANRVYGPPVPAGYTPPSRVNTVVRTAGGPRVVAAPVTSAGNPQRLAMEAQGSYPDYTPTAEDKAWAAEAAARAAALSPEQLAAANDSNGFIPDSYQAGNVPGQWDPKNPNADFRTSPQIDAMLANLVTAMAQRGLQQNMAGRKLASDGMPFGNRTLEQSIGFGYRPWDPLAGLTPAQRTQGNLDFLRQMAMEEGGYTPPTGAGAW